MTMTPRLRKFVLTAHVVSSVGWLGAGASFLALAVTGLTSQDAQTVRAADLGGPQTEAVIRAGGALLMLLVATALAVYKPWGSTSYGRRKQHEGRTVLVPRGFNSSRQKSRAVGDEKGGDVDLPKTSPSNAHGC